MLGATRAHVGLEGLRGWATSVNPLLHSNRTQGRSALASWARPSGTCAGAVLPARGCPLAPTHSSQGLMSVSMATQLYAA